MSDTKTFLAFSCTHCPLHDNDAIRWLVDQIAIRQPDYVIHLGDGHEADSASRFATEYSWSLEDEYIEHDRILFQIRQAYEPATRIFLEGNHELNIRDWLRLNRKVRGLCHYLDHQPELKHYWERPTEYIYGPGGFIRLGQVTFAHGYVAGASADEVQSITLGIPYGLFVGGHTHKPIPVSQARKTSRVKLPYWFANAGCMRDLKPHYARRWPTTNWGQAIVVGQFKMLDHPSLAREWDAETVIYRMGDEYVEFLQETRPASPDRPIVDR